MSIKDAYEAVSIIEHYGGCEELVGWTDKHFVDDLLSRIYPYFCIDPKFILAIGELEKAKAIFKRKEEEYIERCRLSRIGTIYLIELGGFYKIGRTKDIERRFSEFKDIPPFNPILVYAFESQDLYKAEAALHKYFTSKRAHKEWYILDEEDIEYIRTL